MPIIKLRKFVMPLRLLLFPNFIQQFVIYCG